MEPNQPAIYRCALCRDVRIVAIRKNGEELTCYRCHKPMVLCEEVSSLNFNYFPYFMKDYEYVFWSCQSYHYYKKKILLYVPNSVKLKIIQQKTIQMPTTVDRIIG